jgi:dihydrofolate synthase/folylpolyglutamate synthase
MFTKQKPTQLSDWVAYLLDHHPIEKIWMGLERVAAVAKRLNLLKMHPAQVITVAGTNGKGSTCRIIEAILVQSDYRVGVYSSPHFNCFSERVRIQEKSVEPSRMVEALSAVEAARAETELTFFEFATLAALWLFKQQKLDYILLEVGLGGRLDATNVIDSDLSILTSIDYDHMEYLGHTLDAIGLEKAGVMRSNCLSVCGMSHVPASVVSYGLLHQVKLKRRDKDFSNEPGKHTWEYRGTHWHYPELPYPKLHLNNATTALAALEALLPKLPYTSLVHGLEKANLPGRLERYRDQPLVVLDVAHNRESVQYLAQTLKKKQPSRGKVYALFGALNDKPIQDMISEVDPYVDCWHFVRLATARRADMTSVQANLNRFSTKHCSMQVACQELKTLLLPEDQLYVFGSFYTVSEFKSHYS